MALERSIAVKVVHDRIVETEPSLLKILLDEARHSARLIGHPNVVATLDVGEYTQDATNLPFIVFEFVEGVPLDIWLARHALALSPETRQIVHELLCLQVCDALDFAHSFGVLHRDVKPSNMLLWKYGVPKVADFGISRVIDAATRTHTVWNFRSPAYCSPEQWSGEKPDKSSDVYQLACAMFQVLTGRLPFSQDSLPALMNSHLNEEPPDATSINPLIPDVVSSALRRAMTKRRAERAELWDLHDSLARSALLPVELSIDVSEADEATQNEACRITDFPKKELATGVFTCEFPDAREAVGEIIQLSFNGVPNLNLRRADWASTT